jgi:hypothetical protein
MARALVFFRRMLHRMRRAFSALLPLLLLVSQPGSYAAEDRAVPPEPIGSWRGELEQGDGLRAIALQLVLYIRQGADGYSGTLDGLGPELRNLKIEGMVLVEDVLSFQVPQVDGRFAGNFYGDSLRGTWSRGEQSWPLIFFRE